MDKVEMMYSVETNLKYDTWFIDQIYIHDHLAFFTNSELWINSRPIEWNVLSIWASKVANKSQIEDAETVVHMVYYPSLNE